MNKSPTILCSLQGETSLRMGSETLLELISSAKMVERRIEKGANPEDERRRYNLLCDRIEQEVIYKLVAGEAISSLELDGSSLDLLAEFAEWLTQEESFPFRLAASFFTPDELKRHISALKKAARKLGAKRVETISKELEFLESAMQVSACVVILQNTQSSQQVNTDVASQEKGNGHKEERLRDTLTDNSRLSYEAVVTKQIVQAIEQAANGQAGALNFSNHRNDVITEVLHKFVYAANGRQDPLLIKVVYADGSEARPFPLFCLRSKGEADLQKFRKQLNEIKVGLMSARHAEKMDSEMDIYWFRNQEISVSRALAETDEVCYRKSKEMLEKMRVEGNYRLGLYQTGLEPAVVGFYRALTEELMLRAGGKPSLEVTPYYLTSAATGYEGGSPWN